MLTRKQQRALPFSLTAVIVLLDQITKGIIVEHFPLGGRPLDVFNNELLWICHVRNPAIAFSLGDNLPHNLRPALFVVLPLVLLAVILVYYLKTDELSLLQRWVIAGIFGGGAGNLIDRIARPDGVVDFISVKFFGLFGFERWPTFNVADSSVVVCAFIWIISTIIAEKPPVKAAGQETKN
jgi:signal peptidase II